MAAWLALGFVIGVIVTLALTERGGLNPFVSYADWEREMERKYLKPQHWKLNSRAMAFDSVTRKGVAGSVAQSVTVHLVDPVVSGLTGGSFEFRHSLYRVLAVDLKANTVDLFPWLPSDATAGCLILRSDAP